MSHLFLKQVWPYTLPYATNV